jgi:hypothetical protein
VDFFTLTSVSPFASKKRAFVLGTFVALALRFLLSVPLDARAAGAAFTPTTTVPSETAIFNARISIEYPRVVYQVDDSIRHGYIFGSGTAYAI